MTELAQPESFTPPVPERYTSPTEPHPFRIGEVVWRKTDGSMGRVVFETCPSGLSGSFLLQDPASWREEFESTPVGLREGTLCLTGGRGASEKTHQWESRGQVISPRELTDLQLKLQECALDDEDLRERGRAKLIALMTAEQCIADRIVRGEPVSAYAIQLDGVRQQRALDKDPNVYRRPDYTQYADIDVESVLRAASGEDVAA